MTAETSTDSRWGLLEQTMPMLIGGELITDGDTSDIVSSRNRQVVGRFAVPDEATVERAVATAKKAAPGWAALTGEQRGRYLLKIADIMEKHAADFEFLDAVDIGKPVTAVRYSDMPVSLSALAYFAGRAQELGGRSVDVGDPMVSHRARLEPYGVVLEVLPWNGPLWTGVQRMAAILAAGNVAIMKPSELASASFSYLASLIADVLPPGVLTVINGRGSKVGAQLVKHPDVAMVSLTGGIETGVRILQDTAAQVKRVSLELGGKNPNIVLDDADLDTAVMWSTMGAFSNSGQVCVCGSRILVQRGIYEEFSKRLVAEAKSREVGDPLLEGTAMGPVVGEDHYNKIWKYIDNAVLSREGELLVGGERYTDKLREGGWFVPPTVFGNVEPSCTIAREEIFGPVVTLTPVADLDEALAIANDTKYGLASGIFTTSVDHAEKAARELQAGQVYINQWFAPGGLQAPSQGYKTSGVGGVGIDKYLQTKNIFTRTTAPSSN